MDRTMCDPASMRFGASDAATSLRIGKKATRSPRPAENDLIAGENRVFIAFLHSSGGAIRLGLDGKAKRALAHWRRCFHRNGENGRRDDGVRRGGNAYRLS